MSVIHLGNGPTSEPEYRSGVNLPDGRVGAPSFDDKTSSMPSFDVLPRYYPHQTFYVPPAPPAAPAAFTPAPVAPPRELTPEPEEVEEDLDDDHAPFAPYGSFGEQHLPGYY